MVLVGITKLTYGQGIQFEKKSWKEVLQLSQELDKTVFVDVYTTWCGPCKKVAKTVFTQEKVGKFYNENFINAKIDGESKEGVKFVEKYNIKSYPTFLYLDKNGDVLYRFVGAKKAKDFIGAISKIKIVSKYGGWEKMDSIYHSGKGNPNLFYDYYSIMSGKRKENALNAFLKNLPEDELMDIEMKDLITNTTIYDDVLMNKVIDGLIPRCGVDKDYDFVMTFGIRIHLNKILKKAIKNGNEERFNQIMKLKHKFYSQQNKKKQDSDLALNGRGLFFSSPDLCKLIYAYTNSSRDGEFKSIFEKYITNFMQMKIPNRFLIEREPKNPTKRIYMFALLKDQIPSKLSVISEYLVQMIDYYWLLSDSDKTTKKKCHDWLLYVYNLNPYNYNAASDISNLLIEMGYKKKAIEILEETVALQAKLANEKNKDIVNLQRRLNKYL